MYDIQIKLGSMENHISSLNNSISNVRKELEQINQVNPIWIPVKSFGFRSRIFAPPNSDQFESALYLSFDDVDIPYSDKYVYNGQPIDKNKFMPMDIYETLSGPTIQVNTKDTSIMFWNTEIKPGDFYIYGYRTDNFNIIYKLGQTLTIGDITITSQDIEENKEFPLSVNGKPVYITDEIQPITYKNTNRGLYLKLSETFYNLQYIRKISSF